MARRFLHLAGTAAARSLLSPYDLGQQHEANASELQDKVRDYAAAEAELRIAVGYFRESLGNDHPCTVVLLAQVCLAMVDGGAANGTTINANLVSAFEEALAAANACVERPQNTTTTRFLDCDDDDSVGLHLEEREVLAMQLLGARHARADVLLGLGQEFLKSTEARRVAQARGHLLQAKEAYSELLVHPQRHLVKILEAQAEQGLENVDWLLAKAKRLEKAASKRR